MKSFWVDPDVLQDYRARLQAAKISYGLGAKASLNVEPEKITKIDCSGYLRYLLYHITKHEVNIQGGGSWWQNKWCKDVGLEVVDYSTAAELDGWLRIGYFAKPAGMAAGHIWLVLNGSTLESHGGKGPDSRPWDTAKLVKHVEKCYKFGPTHRQSAPTPWSVDEGITMYA